MSKRKAKPIGHVTDKPLDILNVARSEFKYAKTPPAVRQAAEKAHLAVSSAVEVALGRNVHSYSEQMEGIKTIAKRARRDDLPKRFSSLRRELHGECFHGASCVNVEYSLGRAEELIAQILAVSPKGRHRK